MKNHKQHGHSARQGNRPAPYTKYAKQPYAYRGEQRLASGELKTHANDKPGNRYP